MPTGPASNDPRSDSPAATDEARPGRVPAQWRRLGDELAQVLQGMPSPESPRALDDLARRLAELAARAPDVAIFLVVSPDHGATAPYGVVRSLQAATAALLVARRLEWAPERCLTLVKAAFTMNIGMLALQERLSNQARLSNPAQRQTIQMHPATGAATLRACGVTDAEWLDAVANHHERPGGGGYPSGVAQVGEMASALRAVDLYTAALAGRSGRDGLASDRAARDLLVVERGNPFALALVADVGLYPPGSLVRLQCGEVGVVVRRGATTDADGGAPAVAVLAGRRCELLADPLLREASGIEFGIAGPADARSLKLRVNAERVYDALAAWQPPPAALARTQPADEGPRVPRFLTSAPPR